MVSQLNYPAHIASLKPYVPGKPIGELARRLGRPPNQVAKLASNENPFGHSPLVTEALKDKDLDLSRYPDNDCADLTSALAAHHDLSSDWLVLGGGSESVISNAVATFLEVGRRTAYSRYSFQAYVNAAQKVGAVPIVVDSPDFVVDLHRLREQLVQEPLLVYIANPGNPTGTCVDPGELESFLRAVPRHIVVLLDEAYYEFMPASERLDSLRLVRELPNLLVTRTFSKAYGLAGLRVGYGIAQPEMADMLRRARPPFTVTQQAQVAAMAALRDSEFIRLTVSSNEAVRNHLAHELAGLGIRTLESHTNFVLAEVGDGSAWARRLESHGLIVRPVTSYGLARWVRISIGTAEDIDRLVTAMRITLAVKSPQYLVAGPSADFASVKEFVAKAKASPGKYSYASVAVGSASHLTMEMFKRAAGIHATHIPYRGATPAVADLLGGNVHAAFMVPGNVLQFAKQGRLKLLASSGEKRWLTAPDVPTLIELGYRDLEATGWVGLLAPGGTPKPIIDRYYREMMKILRMPDVAPRLHDMEFDIVASTPEQFAAWIRSETSKWGAVVKLTGAKAE